MKAGRKKDEVELDSLPEVNVLVASLNWLAKESNIKRSKDALNKTKQTDFIWLTREELKTYARDKGFYQPDEKKRDKANEAQPRDATPAVLADAFTSWCEEFSVSKRVEKKEIADAIASGKPLPAAAKKKDDKKKDEKKKPAGGKKDDEEVEEPEEVFPKDYEWLVLVENFPENEEELLAVAQTKGGFDCLVNVDLNFVHKKVPKPAAHPDAAQGGSDEAGVNGAIMEAHEDEEINEVVVPEIAEAKMTPEEFEEVQQRRLLKESLQQARKHTHEKSRLRNCISVDVNISILIEELNHSWDKMKDEFFKTISDASLLRKDYQNWLKGLRVRPLLTPKHVAAKVDTVHTEVAAKEDPKKDDKTRKKDGAKDAPKDPAKKPPIAASQLVSEQESSKAVAEHPKEMAYIEAKELVKKLEDKLNCPLELLRGVNVLDSLAEILDKHRFDFEVQNASQITSVAPKGSGLPSTAASTVDIDTFLDDLFEQVESAPLGADIHVPVLPTGENSPGIPRQRSEILLDSNRYKHRGIYSAHDKIGISKRGQGRFGSKALEQLERETISKVRVPGIDRFQMPVIPPHSQQTRQAKLGLIGAFHQDVDKTELERLLLLDGSAQMVSHHYKDRTWSFFDRNQLECLDTDLFRQRYLSTKFNDGVELVEYQPLLDCVIIGNLLHGSRQTEEHREWHADWAVVPELNEWVAHFKNNAAALSKKSFFALDPHKFGGIVQHQHVFDLCNLGAVAISRVLALGRQVVDVRVYYPSLVAGIQPSEPRTIQEKLQKKEIIERELVGEELENVNPILKDKKKKRTKEEEDAIIRFVKEEKIHEDVLMNPPNHSLVWLSLSNGTKVQLELEREVDPDKLTTSGTKLDKPVFEVFGIQSQIYKTSAVTTLTTSCGVVTKVLANGDILLRHLAGPANREEYRLITKAGSALLFFANGKKEVLFSNGNRLEFVSGTWTSTNNQGLRKKMNASTGEEDETAPVPTVVQSQKPLIEYPVISFREDGTKIVIYENGDRFVTFKDGTKILSTESTGLTLIESPGLPTVRITRGQAAQGEVFRVVSQLETKARAWATNGVVSEVILPESSKLFVYEAADTEAIEAVLESSDGTLFRTSSEGTAILIPSETRYKLTELELSGKRRKEQRKRISQRADEMDRAVNNMQEAMVGMSKVGKAKKMTKKQIKEEKDREEQKIVEFIKSAKEALAREIDQLEQEGSAESAPNLEFELLRGHSSRKMAGVFYFECVERYLMSRDPEGRTLQIDDQGSYNIDDPVGEMPAELVDMYDLESRSMFGRAEPSLLAYFGDGRGYELLSRNQTQELTRLGSLQKNFKIHLGGKVKDYLACDSLALVSMIQSQESCLATPDQISQTAPRPADYHAQHNLFAVVSRPGPLAPESFRIFRELWRFSGSPRSTAANFRQSMEAYQAWNQELPNTASKLGFPQRHPDSAKSTCLTKEKAVESRALVLRQTERDFERPADRISAAENLTLTELAEEQRQEADRIRERIEQMDHETEIARREKRDPYDPNKDRHLEKARFMLLMQEEFKTQKLHEEELKMFSNKFVNNYFYTVKGLEFSRLNPSTNYQKQKFDDSSVKELQELGKQILEEEKALHVQSAEEHEMMLKRRADGTADGPDGTEDQHGLGNTGGGSRRAFRIKSQKQESVGKILERDRQQLEAREREKNRRYLEMMKKEMDLYGNPRKPLPKIMGMFRSQAEQELNEKVVEVEGPVERRVKISSMSQRMYIHAPSTDELRNEGMHQTLMKSMDKGNSHDLLLSRKKLMPDSIKQDKMERDFVIFPPTVDFGTVRPGVCYKTEVYLINDNYFMQRLKVQPPTDSKFTTVLNKNGPMAMGQHRRITVFLNAEDLDEGELDAEFYVISKYRKYTIPLKVNVGPNTEQVDSSMNKAATAKHSTGGLLKKTASSKKLTKREVPDHVGTIDTAKYFPGILEIKEVNKREVDQAKTRTSGEGTGTITQDYLPKMQFDRNVAMDIESTPEAQKQQNKRGPIDYDDDDSQEER